MTDDDYETTAEWRLKQAALDAGAQWAGAVDGDVYVEWYLSDLLEFCQEWRSEIEELG